MIDLAVFFGAAILSFVWFCVVVLPLVYGLPRALIWRTRGWARGGTRFYLITPLVWSLGFVGVMVALVTLLPGVADALTYSTTGQAGQAGGVIFGLARALFSASARRDLRHDFLDHMKPHLTPTGAQIAAVKEIQ